MDSRRDAQGGQVNLNNISRHPIQVRNMNGNDGHIAMDEGTNNNVVFGDQQCPGRVNGAAATNGGEPADHGRQHRRRGDRRRRHGGEWRQHRRHGAKQRRWQALAGASQGIVFNNNSPRLCQLMQSGGIRGWPSEMAVASVRSRVSRLTWAPSAATNPRRRRQPERHEQRPGPVRG